MGTCSSSTTLLLSSLQVESDEVIDPSQKAEDEGLPVYKPNEYYPTRIVSVINDRGQVVSKLASLASARGMLYFAPILITQIAFNMELMTWKLQGNDDKASLFGSVITILLPSEAGVSAARSSKKRRKYNDFEINVI